jgi:tRNA(fMet)-specific endonuclease VapC
MYVLDTNTVAYFFKGLGKVAERLLATPPAEVALPAIVSYELWVGVERSREAIRRRQQLERFLGIVQVLPFGPREARAAAGLRAALEQTGTPIGPLDTLIAGTAVAHGGTLVTRNVREFSRISRLSIENWYSDP